MPRSATCPELALCAALRPAVGWDRVAVSVVVQAGRQLPLTGSDLALQRFSNFQQSLAQGPCQDALLTRTPVLVDDLRSSAAPWQLLLSTTARQFPVRSTASVPLLGAGTGGEPVGVLVVGRDEVSPFSDPHVEALVRLADVVTRVLLARGARGDLLADVPCDDVPVLVGMLRARLELDEAGALARVRAYAFGAGRTVHDVAADAVAGRLALEDVGLAR